MEPQTTAIYILDYAHAPAIGFYFLGALAFGLCTLQKPITLGFHERWICVCLMLALVIGYLVQGIYYLNRVAKGSIPPQHSGIHVFSSVLVWGFLTTAILQAKSILWQPYLSVFIVQFLFEAVLCILGGISISTDDLLGGIPFILGILRVILSQALMAWGLRLLRLQRNRFDQEAQPLLTSNVPSDDNQGENEEDQEIRKQQQGRLEREGGWVGYMKGFALFLPYLWPRDDRKITICLCIRLIDVILDRILNPLIPHQLGLITDKIVSGSTIIPWKDIGLWTFYRWLGSSAGFGIVAGLATEYCNSYTNLRIKDLAFQHIMSLSMDFHSNKDSGEVLKAVDQASSLITVVEALLFTIGPVLVDFAVAMWYVAHLFDIYMTYIVLSIGIVHIWLGVCSSIWTNPRRRQYVESLRHEYKTVDESIRNWTTVTYFNRADFERKRYQTAIQTTTSAKFAYLSCFYAGHLLQNWLITFGFSGCCILAIFQVVSGAKPIGNLITLLMYWSTITSPLSTIANSYKSLSSALVDTERLLQILETKPSIADNEQSQQLSNSSVCAIEFKNVSFAYNDKPVLENVSFIAKPGEKIAIVGESGGGKSTLLKLIYRLYDVTSGSITINDHNIRSLTISSLRGAIGVVPQEPALFNQSILDNLRFACLNATDQQIQEACKVACIHKKVDSFPNRYNSVVGERGVKLSGGERQRIALAQALLQDTPVLVLDEATSAMDSITEADVQNAFTQMSSRRTTIVVAHRLSTILDAEQILVMDNGKIIERGTHSELLTFGGKYAELWGKQLGM